MEPIQASMTMHPVFHFASAIAVAYVSMISILYSVFSVGMAWSMYAMFLSVPPWPPYR